MFSLYCDGGSRENNLISGSGAVIYDENDIVVWEKSQFNGKGTNNEAEYKSLLMGLTQVIERKINNLVIKMDSLLVINHMKGLYKVKAPNLIPLYNECKKLCTKILKIEFVHVLRDKNKYADSLATKAILENKKNGLIN
jgi:ribonuclease HI